MLGIQLAVHMIRNLYLSKCITIILNRNLVNEFYKYRNAGIPVQFSVIFELLIMIEICYLDIVDASGLRLFYTKQLRKNDVGVMTLGHLTIPTLIIPEKQNYWNITGYCPKSCTERVGQFLFPLTIIYLKI